MDKNTMREVSTLAVKLHISFEEAMEVWKFDNEQESNDVVDEIESKISSEKEKKKGPSTIGKVLTMKAKKKADAVKTSIVNAIFDYIEGDQLFRMSQQMTSNKMSFKAEDGSYYTVAITKHKSKPDGFKDEG